MMQQLNNTLTFYDWITHTAEGSNLVLTSCPADVWPMTTDHIPFNLPVFIYLFIFILNVSIPIKLYKIVSNI